MLRAFFGRREWLVWSWPGAAIILAATWFAVQLDVKINSWIGDFWDTVQNALAKPGSVAASEIYLEIVDFGKIAMAYVLLKVAQAYFTKHWCFRWRQALNDHYMKHWAILRHIEGSSQRIQEDTMRFAQIMESLGASFLESVMTLVAFLPVLDKLSKNVTELPLVGDLKHSLVYVAVVWALFGTALLGVVGIRLPGLEFQNQLVEAAYRKELVLGEDDEARAGWGVAQGLFGDVRRNYFTIFLNYAVFDVAKWSYLTWGMVVPFTALAPTMAAGRISLGTMHRTIMAFSQVESSFQYLVRSWERIVDLISVFKRLYAFEKQLAEKLLDADSDYEDGAASSGMSEEESHLSEKMFE